MKVKALNTAAITIAAMMASATTPTLVALTTFTKSRRIASCALLAVLLTSLGSNTGAVASIVTFEDQPAGPNQFPLTSSEQNLNYSFGGLAVTFSGGVILTNELGQTTDNSNVYATCNSGFCFGPTLANPLVVTFSQPIQNFQIQIANAIPGDYELYDNAGHQDFFSLAINGGSLQTIGFAATGTTVDVAYLFDNNSSFGSGNWAFAIDNVTFNQPLSATPLPAALPLFFSGLGVMGFLAKRRKWKGGAAIAAA
jgi:hypothetical protein